MSRFLPKKLQKGDKVALVTPSGAKRDGQLEVCISALEKLGLEVIPHDSVFLDNGYFAGTEEQRAAALNELFADESIAAIFCIRGGCGASETVRHLNFDIIAKNQKPFIGMSDVTYLQNAIYQKTGMPVLAGPVVLHFNNDLEFALDDLNKKLFNDDFSFDLSDVDIVREGEAEGVVLGGNLMVFTTTLGTQYAPKDENIILFLEEVTAYRYVLDRMLNHLENAGVLDKVTGVVIGDFISHDVDSYHLTFEEIILKHVKKDIPICSGAKFGHNNHHEIFPIGAKAKLVLKNSVKNITFI